MADAARAVAVAHARPARPHLRQLCRHCRGGDLRSHCRPHGEPARSRRPPGPTSPGCARSGRGPLLLKGVLHPDEARRAVAEGIDGIIVSNHGGRQLDGAAGDHRRPARDRRGRRRADPGAARRRRPPRRRRGQGPGAGRHRLPDRPAASVGPGRRRRGRRGRRARPLPPRDRPRHGAVRLGPGRHHCRCARTARATWRAHGWNDRSAGEVRAPRRP